MASNHTAIEHTITPHSSEASENSATVEDKITPPLLFVAADHPKIVESVTTPPTSLSNENSLYYAAEMQSKNRR